MFLYRELFPYCSATVFVTCVCCFRRGYARHKVSDFIIPVDMSIVLQRSVGLIYGRVQKRKSGCLWSSETQAERPVQHQTAVETASRDTEYRNPSITNDDKLGRINSGPHSLIKTSSEPAIFTPKHHHHFTYHDE